MKSSEEDYSSIFMSLSNNHHRLRDENFIQSYCQDERKNYIDNELKDFILKIFYGNRVMAVKKDYEFTVIFYKDFIFFLFIAFGYELSRGFRRRVNIMEIKTE